MNVLVINSGSSSLKYQLMEVETQEVFAKGNVERIGGETSIFSFKGAGKEIEEVRQIKDHTEALKLVVDQIMHAQDGEPVAAIDAVGHRVVQGAHYFSDSVLITDEVLEKIKEVSPLAPLHNYAALATLEGIKEVLPDLPNVAVFDTSFHQTMPEVAWRYPLERELSDKLKLRKYGFHGTSHRFVYKQTAEFLGEAPRKMVVAHIGNGASLCAVKDGQSIETTMGFTPLDGLMMGTRCGSIDPAIVTYLQETEGMSVDEVNTLMNKKSGLLGISGISNDMRLVEEAAEKGDAHAQMAIDMLAYSVKKLLGQCVFALGGIEVLSFTAGCGENDDLLRKMIIDGLEDLGFKLDLEKNAVRSREPRVISTEDSRVKILIVPTNEEYMIALDVQRLVTQ